MLEYLRDKWGGLTITHLSGEIGIPEDRTTFFTISPGEHLEAFVIS
ncbi:MAG TPA: hypothetical protein VKR61_16460 [Bryobacteraceae bacterium]|nr:hypothetical protein [Bryobacteraceae bacterium]